ncbi:bifunctional biotin--[acetyl-CoA-carboxylase] ligase/biotin operon repressor BirA [Luteimonas kalidii]|uniref:Bifunctional ligase/repressor BirA n=1 Tax=Luteimonas kalidii TaxID=3042025 RepID=A0ABT6JXE0_9GAMM|nr:bifunctional biotin--[acetyl-CoA-carboxylase] ligase/biotin operon repressor BirA [Luteimonas kalidii]MDH5835373.1 bifunctional biotin--[acetyl-CoA-carboxylase] ligase/biotin operon repressor BirA [Luteimonas kalidii]
MTASADRALLQRLAAGPVSGDTLAREAGQTRAAVWKRIQALREAGVAIEAQPGRGYVLAGSVDLLDAQRIHAALPPALQADVDTLEVAWSLDSTSSELLRRTQAGRGVQVLLAERQTGGRGRRGRPWASPLAANLYLSVARRFEGGLARLGGLSLVAGVAVVESLRALGIGRAGLKWPNDVVVADGERLRKLGGILVEGGGEHGGPARAVIGIGLNVRMPDATGAGIDQPWIDLRALHDPPPPRDAVAAALLGTLLPALSAFDREGLAPVLARYAGCDVLAGREVRVQAGDGVHQGMALGLAGDGALRVRTPLGERVFHAGEASLRTGGNAG